MKELKEALPAAFDSENEEKNGPYEQEAFNLYGECEEALNRPAPAQPTPKKRERDARDDEAAKPKSAFLHTALIGPAVISPAMRIRHERPEKKRKTATVAEEESAAARGGAGMGKSIDAMDVDEHAEYSFPHSLRFYVLISWI